MSSELAAKLLERNRVGVLIRVFAFTQDAVPFQIASAMDALSRLLALRTNGRPTISRVDFLVSSDPDYEDTDCGLTASSLRDVITREFPDANVFVSEIKKGDLYCMLLNYGIAMQLEDRIPYSFIMSHRTSCYITEENIHALLGAMYTKARVAGLILPEMKDVIRKGRVLNTFAIWHNKSLVTIGGFDLRSAKPGLVHAHLKEKIVGWSKEKEKRHGDGTVQYHLAGCEEIIPEVRLIRFFGPCIQVFAPSEELASVCETPLEVDPKAYHRHFSKLATKEERQRRFAAMEGVDLEFIEKGLMRQNADTENEVS
jgi:hypothetical protein